MAQRAQATPFGVDRGAAGYESLLFEFLPRRGSALAQIAGSKVALRRETGMRTSVAVA